MVSGGQLGDPRPGRELGAGKGLTANKVLHSGPETQVHVLRFLVLGMPGSLRVPDWRKGVAVSQSCLPAVLTRHDRKCCGICETPDNKAGGQAEPELLSVHTLPEDSARAALDFQVLPGVRPEQEQDSLQDQERAGGFPPSEESAQGSGITPPALETHQGWRWRLNGLVRAQDLQEPSSLSQGAADLLGRTNRRQTHEGRGLTDQVHGCSSSKRVKK